VLTSPTSAAVRDFLEVVRRRWADVRITIVPVRVQGDGAADEIRLALEKVQRWDPGPEVVVITRGGGSLEDLWCFNDEQLVRAVRQCSIPVVSAVGHDIDVTLCDLAADVRALTPTEAGERVVPDREQVCKALESLTIRLRHQAQRAVHLAREQLQRFAQSPALRRPLEPIRDRQRRLDELQLRALRAVAMRLEAARHQTAAAAGRLESLSPIAILARGYSVTWDAHSGELIRAVAQLRRGGDLVTQFVDGRAVSRIERLEAGHRPGIPERAPAQESPCSSPVSNEESRT
jgi:exodeoxyribonuclease VII large subunit